MNTTRSTNGADWATRIQYLSAGVNTGSGWATWNAPAGEFALLYMNESDANGYIPVLTYYMLLQSNPATGATEAAKDYNNLQNTSTMNAYYADFKLLMQKCATFNKPVIVHVEPDLWGYLQGVYSGAGQDPNTCPASVASSGHADAAGLPNTAVGFAQALRKLRDLYGGPQTYLAVHFSIWGSGNDLMGQNLTVGQIDTELNKSGVFYNALDAGAYRKFDLFFFECSDNEAAINYKLYGNTTYWWDNVGTAIGGPTPATFSRHRYIVDGLSNRITKRSMNWQVPIGNSYYRTCNNSAGHFRSPFSEGLLGNYAGPAGPSHIKDYSNAGVIGWMWRAGNSSAWGNGTNNQDIQADGTTNGADVAPGTFGGPVQGTYTATVSDDDGGYLRFKVGNYYTLGCLLLSGAPTFTVTATRTPVFSPTPTPTPTADCPVMFNSAETLTVNGTWSGTSATRTLNAVNITQGTNSLRAAITTAAAWNVNVANLAGFTNNVWAPYTALTMDIYVDPAAPIWGPLSSFHNLYIYVDSASASKWFRLLTPVIALNLGWNNITVPLVWTADVTVPAILPTDPLSLITLALSMDYQQTGSIYIDNMVLHTGSACVPTPTQTPSRTISPSPTMSVSPSESPTRSHTPTLTNSPSPSNTRTSTPTPSNSPSASLTVTPSGTRSGTPTVTNPASPTSTRTATASSTSSPSPSDSPTPGATATASSSSSPTRTVTPSVSPSSSRTSTVTPSATRTVTVTVTPSASRTDTVTVSPTRTATPTRTDSPSPSATRTGTATVSETSTGTLSPTISPTSSDSPTAGASATPSFSVSPTRTASPSPSVSPSRTATLTRTVTLTSTESRTASPTHTDSPTRTATRTATATVSPSRTRTGTMTPTGTRTATVTLSATVSPTSSSSPTAGASATPSFSVSPTESVSPTTEDTATPTGTASETETETASPSETETETVSPSETETETASPSETETETVSPTEADTPTVSETASAGATFTSTATASRTVSPSPTRTATRTASLTATRSSTPSGTPSATASSSPSRTPTYTSSTTRTNTPLPSATATQTATVQPPSATPTVSMTSTAVVPVISTLGSSSGLTTGGYSLAINGSNFLAGATVTIDGSPATVVSNTGSVITVTVPAHAVGTVSVVVTNPGGFNSNAATFDYVAPTPTSTLTSTPTSTAPATPTPTFTVTPTSTVTPLNGPPLVTQPTLPPSTVDPELMDVAAVPNPVLLADASSPLGFAVKVKGSPASVQASLYTLALVCVGEWELPLLSQTAPESWQMVRLPVNGLASGTYYAQFRIAGKKRLCKLVVMR